MAYAIANPPVKKNYGGLTSFGATEAGANYGGHNDWVYASADPIATVQGANYFSDGIQRGMQVNDLVYVIDTNLNHAYLLAVVSQTPTVGGPPQTGSVSLNTSGALTVY